MAIKSHAFGRVTLTGRDADKFNRQVAYGRPTQVARASVARGTKLYEEFASDGQVRVTLKKPAK